MPDFIEIDASQGEGGGQVLRTSLALSALLEKPVHVFNIRAGRPNPGLKAQHLASLKALAAICGAETKGSVLHSQEIFFSPKKILQQKLNINIGTAGSVSLLLQQLLPAALKAELQLRIVGGTDVAFAPSIFFLQNVLFPKLKSMNAKLQIGLLSHGYFPKGNGRVVFASKHCLPLKHIELLETGSLLHFDCFSNSSSLPFHVSKNQAIAAKTIVLEKFSDVDWIEKIGSNPERKETVGSAIDLFAFFEKTVVGANSLGEKGKPAEKVGREAAEKLLLELSSKKPVDSHCADQLLLFMALAKGKSKIAVSKLTTHCTTNIGVIEKFLPVKFFVEGSAGKEAVISVDGIGFK